MFAWLVNTRLTCPCVFLRISIFVLLPTIEKTIMADENNNSREEILQRNLNQALAVLNELVRKYSESDKTIEDFRMTVDNSGKITEEFGKTIAKFDKTIEAFDGTMNRFDKTMNEFVGHMSDVRGRFDQLHKTVAVNTRVLAILEENLEVTPSPWLCHQSRNFCTRSLMLNS